MSAPVVSILNMKGGVGKTTISAHVMRVLYHHMLKKVLLIDLDAQFNLTQSIQTEAQYENILQNGHTIISGFEPLPSGDFFKIRKSSDPPPSAQEIAVRLRSVGRRGSVQAQLDLIPGSFDLMKYSMIDDPIHLKRASSYFERFISQARKEYDLVVVDCNPSSSFVTKCALENSSHVISPVKLDKFSLLGVGLVDRLFEHLKLNLEHMILVNGIRRRDRISQIELELRAHEKYGPRVLRHRLVQSSLLAADPDYTGFATDKRRPYSAQLRYELHDISQEICERLGIS